MIQVSDFSKCDGKYNRFHSSGVLIVWEWELYKFDEDNDNETTTEEESSEDEVEIESAASSSHKLTFKCIGATKATNYQSALREVHDLMAKVAVFLFDLCVSIATHETPGNWLLFVRLKESIVQLGML